jgi:hypothetical protein
MSDRTRLLENTASRALLDFVRDPSREKADAADNVVWRIAEAIIAKVQENVMGEIDGIRRITFAKPDETTTAAVHRVIRERDGQMKKYRTASREWEDERVRLASAVEAASDLLIHLGSQAASNGHPRCPSDAACPRCRLASALEDIDA